jgi:hypothetical protein
MGDTGSEVQHVFADKDGKVVNLAMASGEPLQSRAVVSRFVDLERMRSCLTIQLDRRAGRADRRRVRRPRLPTTRVDFIPAGKAARSGADAVKVS